MQNACNRIVAQHIAGDAALSAAAKHIHNVLRFHPKTTVRHIATIVDVSPETARRHLRQLERHDWLYTFRRGGNGVLHVPWMPLDVETAVAQYVEWLSGNVANRGERLMRFVLDLIVDDPHFVDNARLKSIVSSESGFRLEFDRYLPDAHLAIEFQGRQHFEEIEFREGKTDLTQQQTRDGLKLLACRRQGLTLIEIADTELSPKLLLEKLAPHVALIPPRKDRPLYRTIHRLCHGYANWARSKRRTG